MKTKLSLLALLLACAGCGGVPGVGGMGNFSVSDITSTVKDVQEANKDFTEAEEIELGQDVASNLLGAMPLLQNQKVQTYVNDVGRWLASQTERPHLPWQFAVLDDSSLNAFAAPGGYVFITYGLLKRMKNEAELAGVLSHEIAHVVKKHHLSAIRKAAGARVGKNIFNKVVQKNVNNSLVSAAVQAAGAGFSEVYTKGLDKGDEFEADRMGVVIATRGGYDPYGLPAVLQTLESFSAQDSGLALMFKTHPAPLERITLLEKIMSPSFDRFEKQPSLEARFKSSAGVSGGKK